MKNTSHDPWRINPQEESTPVEVDFGQDSPADGSFRDQSNRYPGSDLLADMQSPKGGRRNNDSADGNKSLNYGQYAIGALVAVMLAVVVGVMLKGGTKDQVSEQQKYAWATSFAAAQPILAKRLTPDEVAPAIAGTPLPETQKQQLQSDVDAGKTRLVWVNLQDTMAEDDDQVRVQSGGYSVDVTLRNKVQKIVLPEPPTGIVNVTGIHDGGGGITIGITSGDIPVNLPYMAAGQTVGIPVATIP